MKLNSTQLRLMALFLMLVDHVGRVLFPEQLWMVCLGRLAFPIFAFQTAEGYRHTRNFKRYCLRLGIFALVSEIPFNLMVGGSLLYPAHQNVMFTLLLGLLACRLFDRGRGWGLIPVFLAAVLFSTDYGGLGVLTVLVFHLFRREKAVLVLLMAGIHCFGYGILSIQSFAMLALVPIFCYGGEKGRGGKWLQYGSYGFYPLHMLILGLL